MNDECIRIWHFCEAPTAYQDLSKHGGDEDWVMFVPKSMVPLGGPRGIVDAVTNRDVFVEEYETEFGTVYIGAHS